MLIVNRQSRSQTLEADVYEEQTSRLAAAAAGAGDKLLFWRTYPILLSIFFQLRAALLLSCATLRLPFGSSGSNERRSRADLYRH